MMLFATTDAVINSLLASGDKPLTLGILAYIVYLLYKANQTLSASDKKQTIAIKWLQRNLQNLHIRVENLERFNQRTHPEEWRAPHDIGTTSTLLDLDND